MNTRDFERKLFELVFQTNIRLTPHNIAYRFGLPFQETRDHLDRLAKENVILMDVDADGVISYSIPGAERPTTDLQKPAPVVRALPVPAKVPPPPPKVQPSRPAAPSMPYGQYFSGPAVEQRATLAAPSSPSVFVLLPVLFALFVFPLVFVFLFLCINDFFGLSLFLFLGFTLLSLCRGSRSCSVRYRSCSSRRNLYY